MTLQLNSETVDVTRIMNELYNKGVSVHELHDGPFSTVYFRLDKYQKPTSIPKHEKFLSEPMDVISFRDSILKEIKKSDLNFGSHITIATNKTEIVAKTGEMFTVFMCSEALPKGIIINVEDFDSITLNN
ncbi:hypothetical protein FHY73_14740 [Bacillus tropicus]|uniref:hypothetical protein n=1 Tax=Bacillus tropicus TaxID=2026188 RepID=UPI0011204A43|nr:hypothetical protein [Bacillus tropicus]TNP18964.1 hypothetical protein FHY73_14740 [Bacillus tropicus]